MILDQFLDKLENVRPAGNGFVALCPGHEDNAQSLGIAEGDDGRILLNCYAGCETQRILDAMGLQMRDLFSNTVNYAEPESVYDYVDEEGQLLFQAIRFPGKRFKQRHFEPDHPDADADGWVWNLDGVRRVIYRLPDVLAAVRDGRTIYITEGEKDAESIRATGRVATCNPMGAGKWRDEFVAWFKDANVIIVADRDEPGRAHATRVANSLQGVAKGVWIRQAKRGKDVTDHLEHGFDLTQLVPIREGPRRGIVTAREMSELALERLDMSESDLPGYQLFENIPIMLRPGRMYAIAAYQGEGKTTGALQLARRLADPTGYGRAGGYFSFEMTEADLMNRLIAHGGVPLRYSENPWTLKADKEMLERYYAAAAEVGEWNFDVIFDTSITAEKIAEVTREREYDFVVVDHIHRREGDRQRLSNDVLTYTNLALEYNIPVILLCQLRKYQRGNNMVAFPRPTIQDFRETSQIADDASMAFALWRQRDDSGTQFVSDQTELIILKNRHTTSFQDATGRSYFLGFDMDKQLFTTGGGHVGQGASDHDVLRPGVHPGEPSDESGGSDEDAEEWWGDDNLG